MTTARQIRCPSPTARLAPTTSLSVRTVSTRPSVASHLAALPPAMWDKQAGDSSSTASPRSATGRSCSAEAAPSSPSRSAKAASTATQTSTHVKQPTLTAPSGVSCSSTSLTRCRASLLQRADRGVLRADRGGRAARPDIRSRRARRRCRPRQLAEHGTGRRNGARGRTPTRRPARDEPAYRRGADRILATTHPPHHMDTGANPPPRPHPKPAPDHPQHHATPRRRTHLPVQLPRPTCSRGYGLGRTYAVNVDSFVRAETYRAASRLHQPMGRRDRAPHRCDPANRPVR